MEIKDINIRAYEECIEIYGHEFVDKYHPQAWKEVQFRIEGYPNRFLGTTKDQIAHRENMMYHSFMANMHRTEKADALKKKSLEDKLNFNNLD